MLLVAHETCLGCGATEMVVCDRDRIVTARSICGQCDARTVAPVWFPVEMWPEVVSLVRFDRVRQAMKLPALTRDVMN